MKARFLLLPVLFAVFSAVLFVGKAFAIGIEFDPSCRCETTYLDGKSFKVCYINQILEPLPYRSQGYSFMQVTGMTKTDNKTGGFDVTITAFDLGTTGSRYSTGPLFGEVAGYYTVTRSDGNVVFYPLEVTK